MIYKVVNAMKTGTYDGPYGEMINYTVQFEGADDGVQISQKPTTPAPKPGDELEGMIEDTKYGKKFKKAQQASGSFGGSKNTDPATRASIEAQTALNAAVTAVRDFNQLKGVDLANVQITAYATQITQVAKLFAKSLSGETITVAAVQEVMPGAEQVADDANNINLDDMPF